MRIVVLNGSPKGEYSNTIHYVKYIMKHRPDHEFMLIDVGKDIKKIEKEPERFNAIIEDIRKSDCVIWSFPLYHLSIPAQLMRFIELVSERGAAGAFKDKYATTVTTSTKFYDHLAHNHIRAVSEDLEMRYIDGFSADMEDIMKAGRRRQLLQFFDHFIDSVKERSPVEKKYATLWYDFKEFKPGELKTPVSIGDKKIVLITDATDADINLSRMLDVFKKSITGSMDIVNINDAKINGGCLGCLNCLDENVCIQKDDLPDIFYKKMAGADAIIFAGKVKGRNFSSRWKMFWDRTFISGHCPIIKDRQFGFIISGPLRQLPDMREELEARARMSNNNIAGFVTDEYDDPAEITSLLQCLASEIPRCMEVDYHLPPTFLAVGGQLVFRDLVYTHRGIFRADDRYYKKHGLYDYPQKDYKNRALNRTLKMLFGIKGIRKRFYKMATVENAKRYQKAVDSD